MSHHAPLFLKKKSGPSLNNPVTWIPNILQRKSRFTCIFNAASTAFPLIALARFGFRRATCACLGVSLAVLPYLFVRCWRREPAAFVRIVFIAPPALLTILWPVVNPARKAVEVPPLVTVTMPLPMPHAKLPVTCHPEPLPLSQLPQAVPAPE